jgi:hypothetical protein
MWTDDRRPSRIPVINVPEIKRLQFERSETANEKARLWRAF